MEKWKAKYASHFPTPSTAERYRQNSLRYTNYPTGTKDRARQAYDRALYKKRNEIERLFRRLKGFRRIFSRFEKLDVLFLGFLNFALIVEALR